MKLLATGDVKALRPENLLLEAEPETSAGDGISSPQPDIAPRRFGGRGGSGVGLGWGMADTSSPFLLGVWLCFLVHITVGEKHPLSSFQGSLQNIPGVPDL